MAGMCNTIYCDGGRKSLGHVTKFQGFFSYLDPLGDGTQSLREAMAVSKWQIVA